jgi:hypothetical protein
LERLKQGKYNKPHWLRYIRGHEPPGPIEEEEEESGVDVLDKPVREYTCTRSTRHCTLTLFLYFSCENTIVQCMLKYHSWEQKENHQDVCI